MIARLVLIILINVKLIQVSIGQNSPSIDSLNRLLPNASLSCQREIYHNLAIEWFNSDKEKSLSLTKRELEVAYELEDSLAIIKSLRLMGQVLAGMERFDSAIQLLSLAGQHALSNGINTEVIYAYQSLGRINLLLGKFDKCLRLYDECLKLPEIEHEGDIKWRVLNNTGIVYYKMTDFDKALDNYFKALITIRSGRATGDVDQLLINIGLCYLQKKELKNGEYYIKLGLQECGEGCSDHISMQANTAFGILHSFRRNYNEAEKFLTRSLMLSKKLGDTRFQLDNIAMLSSIYLRRKDLRAAKRILTDAKPFLDLAPHNLEKREIYSQFVEYSKASGDFVGEALYQRKYVSLSDSLFAQRLAINLMHLEADVQRRESNIKAQAQNEIINLKDQLINSQYYVIVVGGIALLLLIVLLRSEFRRSKVRHRANLLLDEKVREKTREFELRLICLNHELKHCENIVARHGQHLLHIMGRIESLSLLCKEDVTNRQRYLSEICALSQNVKQRAKWLLTETKNR